MANIRVQKEKAAITRERGCAEKCVFCKEPTLYWHMKTNNPVCPACSTAHKTQELVNYR